MNTKPVINISGSKFARRLVNKIYLKDHGFAQKDLRWIPINDILKYASEKMNMGISLDSTVENTDIFFQHNIFSKEPTIKHSTSLFKLRCSLNNKQRVKRKVKEINKHNWIIPQTINISDFETLENGKYIIKCGKGSWSVHAYVLEDITKFSLVDFQRLISQTHIPANLIDSVAIQKMLFKVKELGLKVLDMKSLGVINKELFSDSIWDFYIEPYYEGLKEQRILILDDLYVHKYVDNGNQSIEKLSETKSLSTKHIQEITDFCNALKEKYIKWGFTSMDISFTPEGEIVFHELGYGFDYSWYDYKALDILFDDLKTAAHKFYQESLCVENVE